VTFFPVRAAIHAAMTDFRAPVDATHFVWFRRFFLGKFFFLDTFSLLRDREPSRVALIQTALVGAGVLLAETRRGARIGPLLIFVLKVASIVLSFPYTINHAFFDAALLLMLALYPEGGAVTAHPLRVAQAGILIIFFQAGLQKLANGYYTHGQFLALRAAFDDGDMGTWLRGLLGIIARIGHLEPLPAGPLPRPSSLMEVSVPLPRWALHVLSALSNVVWIAEMTLPLVALGQRRRAQAVGALLALESGILLMSGETSFGFTTTACLLVFFPPGARWRFPLAFAVVAACTAALKG